MKKICALVTLLPMLLFTSVQGVLAVEFEITGNSNESNEVNVSSSNTTQVTQTNNASVNNDITINANTGNNSASNNAGEASIITGNIETNVSVENSLNTSVAQAGCCLTDPNTAKISGNTNGNNIINVNSNNTNTISINQVATINNLVNGSANTGKNKASNNAGNVKISTGWIKQTDTITNKNVNVAQAVIFVGDPAWNVTISGNANDGDNAVLLNLTNNAIVSIYNNADLNNVSLWRLTTGDNTARENTGNVTITTGNIYASSAIKNEGINVSHVKVDCCEEEKVTPPPTPTAPGGGCVSNCGGNGGGDNPKISSGNGGVGGPGSSAGSVLGGAILPATGMSFWLFATIANIFMFLLGLYLRMKAGRSPTTAYATR